MRILLDYTGTGSTKCGAGRLVCSPRSLCRNPPALRCPWERLPCPAPLGDLSSPPSAPSLYNGHYNASGAEVSSIPVSLPESRFRAGLRWEGVGGGHRPLGRVAECFRGQGNNINL